MFWKILDRRNKLEQLKVDQHFMWVAREKKLILSYPFTPFKAIKPLRRKGCISANSFTEKE